MAGRAKRWASGAKVIRLRGKALPTIDKEVVLLRVGSAKRSPRSVNRSDEAEVMVRKLGKALSKPGSSKQVVFRAHSPGKVFAYSAYPGDTTKVVREAADGIRTVGGKFRAE